MGQTNSGVARPHQGNTNRSSNRPTKNNNRPYQQQQQQSRPQQIHPTRSRVSQNTTVNHNENQSTEIPVSKADQKTLAIMRDTKLVDHTPLQKLTLYAGEVPTYESLFLPFIGGKLAIVRMKDPWFHKPHQLHNLVAFIELIVCNAPKLRVFELETTLPFDSEEKKEVIEHLAHIKESLFDRRIAFLVAVPDEKFHDREICFDTGIHFVLGIGIDLFKPVKLKYFLGMHEQRLRQMKVDSNILVSKWTPKGIISNWRLRLRKTLLKYF